mmetsp:Transcript_3617/g.12048  ORF Transcript_3617/g.12048 Transcript_3617/m.12048 type:complete len:218 (+) Transcript_3617:173-826(+)
MADKQSTNAAERAKRANSQRRAGLPPIDATAAHAVGERLSRESLPTPVRLTPRVNSGELTPASEVDRDRQRLERRLMEFGVVERAIEGDGNCQFRAISDQIYGSQQHHGLVRAACVEQLLLGRERYKDYVIAENFEEYVEKMAKDGEWGDHVTLKATADALGTDINLITSFPSSAIICVLSEPTEATVLETIDLDNKPSLWLSFWAEIHYQSLTLMT